MVSPVMKVPVRLDNPLKPHIWMAACAPEVTVLAGTGRAALASHSRSLLLSQAWAGGQWLHHGMVHAKAAILLEVDTYRMPIS